MPRPPSRRALPEASGASGPRLVVSTWSFGLAANEAAWAALVAGGSPLDAVEAGARVTEADASVTSVGRGGLPNASGEVELDAAVMRGDTLDGGAVAALRRVLHPVSVARAVLERSPHVLLAGEGALAFAREHGFAEGELLTGGARDAWQRWRAQQDPGAAEGVASRAGEGGAAVGGGAAGGSASGGPSAGLATAGNASAPGARALRASADGAAPGRPDDDHDTLGLVALDAGRFATAVTTSGLAWKLPGRVGDSPLLGAGGYCDDAAGAAVATGNGEEMIRTCASFAVVEGLRAGLPPEAACRRVLERVRRNMARAGREGQVALLAVARSGRVAAMALRPGFQAAVRDAAGAALVDAEVLA